MNIWLIAIWGGCTAFVIAMTVGFFIAHRIRAARFEHRPDMQFPDIFMEYFKDAHIEKQTAEEVWKEAASALKIPSEKLRPTDRFDKELKQYLVWCPSINLNKELEVVATARVKEMKLKPRPVSKVDTLGDYVLFFCKQH